MLQFFIVCLHSYDTDINNMLFWVFSLYGLGIQGEMSYPTFICIMADNQLVYFYSSSSSKNQPQAIRDVDEFDS